MAVTLQSIAEQLDVSAATVSRSLRHDPLIHPRTRARVNEMALRLGYTERTRRPRAKVEVGTLGLMLRMDTFGDAQHDPNVMRMMEGVMAGADAAGLILNIHGTPYNDNRRLAEDETAVPPMIRDHVCQAVIIQGDHAAPDVEFISRHVPVISLSRIYREAYVDAVVSDDSEGIRALTSHLIGLGHRRLGWVPDYYDSTFFEARQAGFIQGCLGGGVPLSEQRFFGLEIYDGQRLQAWGELVQAAKAGVTGFVCANDFVARQVIDHLEAHGVKVPEQVSVTGFDALPTAPEGRAVTTFDPRFFDMGRAAVRLAVQRLEQVTANPCIFIQRGELVPGATAGAIALEPRSSSLAPLPLAGAGFPLGGGEGEKPRSGFAEVTVQTKV
jgi:DNA-binding LacI/PurR family transcriptional regulator